MRSTALVLLAAVAYLALAAPAADAQTDGAYNDVYYVNSCNAVPPGNAAPSFYPTVPLLGFTSSNACPTSGLQLLASPAGDGTSATWATETPRPDLRIVGVNASSWADCNLHGDGFTANWFYGDNGVNYGAPQITVDCHGATSGQQPSSSFDGFVTPARYFGIAAECGRTGCTSQGTDHLVVAATAVRLAIHETSGPSVTPFGANLYDATEWVRGIFPAGFSASDPSGVCGMQTTVNGATVNSYSDPTPDTSNWSQCPGSQLPGTVNTAAYRDGAGAISLSFQASNAAGVVSTLSRSVNVDNAAPVVSVSGPNDVLSTAGPAHVTATASAGPSGIAQIFCSVDGSAAHSYAGATASIPVSGLGAHSVTCTATNRSLDASGDPAQSQAQTFHLLIRQPTAAAITFARLADALRCRRSVETITLGGRLRAVRRHGRVVRTRGRARHIHRRVLRCHARTTLRTVTVIKRRHGRRVRVRRREHVVVLPHVVDQGSRRIAHGRTTTVSGALELADGVALPDRTVEILAAPDNGLNQYSNIGSARTSANGTWTATVPAGPSRLIEAIYPGDATTEPVVSSVVHLLVPARIALTIRPRVIGWAGSILVRGRLLGGYVPADGVALRFLVRYPGAPQRSPLLALRTDRRGRFAFRWSYHAGRGVATYPFTIATTASESDYPFAASSSRPVLVTFGR